MLGRRALHPALSAASPAPPWARPRSRGVHAFALGDQASTRRPSAFPILDQPGSAEIATWDPRAGVYARVNDRTGGGEHHTGGEPVGYVVGHLEREPGLAHTAGSSERDKATIGTLA